MEFRREWKHEISPGDLPGLRARLRPGRTPMGKMEFTAFGASILKRPETGLCVKSWMASTGGKSSACGTMTAISP